MLLERPEIVIGLVWVAIKVVGPVGLIGIVRQVGLPQLVWPVWLVGPAGLAGTICVAVKLLGREELVELVKLVGLGGLVEHVGLVGPMHSY